MAGILRSLVFAQHFGVAAFGFRAYRGKSFDHLLMQPAVARNNLRGADIELCTVHVADATPGFFNQQ